MKPPPISETAEHAVIAAYLRRVGLAEGAVMWHVRGERHGDMQRIRAAAAGVTAGIPDWCVVYGGQVGFIELKGRGWRARRAKGGRYTPHERRQLEMHARLQAAGAWVEICETLEEVLGYLAHHGVPLRSESLTSERVRRGFAGGLKEAAE